MSRRRRASLRDVLSSACSFTAFNIYAVPPTMSDAVTHQQYYVVLNALNPTDPSTFQMEFNPVFDDTVLQRRGVLHFLRPPSTSLFHTS